MCFWRDCATLLVVGRAPWPLLIAAFWCFEPCRMTEFIFIFFNNVCKTALIILCVVQPATQWGFLFSQWFRVHVLSLQRNSRSWRSVKCILRWVTHFFSRIYHILILTLSANICHLHASCAELSNLEWDSDCPKLSVPVPDAVSEQALVVTGATKQRLLELVSQELEWLLLSFPMRGFPALLSKGSVSVWWSGLWVLHLRQMWGCLRTEASRMMKRPQTEVFRTLWISHSQAGKIKLEVIQPTCVVSRAP